MFNESVKEFEDVIKPEKMEGEDPYEEVIPKTPLPYEAKFFYQKRKKQPNWLGFIESHFDTTDFENHTCSFLILLKTEGRIFAITKGFSSHLFDRKKIENHFGLKVCLNEINPELIKCLDSRSLEVNTKHKRIVVSTNSFLSEFEFNADIELLNLVSGNPSSEELANSMTGSDPISFTRDKITIEELDIVCQELLVSFNKTDYQDQFSFIDYIKPIRDENLVDELWRHLLKDFHNQKLDNFNISYPDFPDLEQVEQWQIWRRRENSTYDDLSIENVIGFMSKFPNPHDINPEEIYVISLDSTENPLRGKQNLEDFINYELEFDGKKYIFSRHRWYLINDDFLSRITESINQIEQLPVGYLPDWDSSKDEGEYNEELARSFDNRELLDKQFLHIDGRGKIEVCDILELPSNFIHVKKYYSSQTMGHLFNQGTVSAQVLREDKDRLMDWLRTKYPTIDITSIEAAINITVIFAIGFKNYDESPIDKLPFFSKIALFNARKTIEHTCGFNMKIGSIPIVGSVGGVKND